MTDTLTRPTVTPPPAEPSRLDVPSGPPPADHLPGGPPDEQPPAGHRRQRRWPRRVAGGAAILALVAGGGTAGGLVADHYLADGTTPAAATTTTATTTSTGTDTGSLAAVAAKVSPSIVTVLIDSANESALGSGVVLTADGLILTNNHVIASGGTVSVQLSDGRTVPARVVAADSTHDLALVQATGVSGLTPAAFATGNDSVAVGDTVLAFGAPLGLSGTVTSGIVSATDRQVDTGTERLTGLIQTDAAINEGNSGGALVDTAGQVIGINVAIATAGDSTGNVGVGFAIPSSTVTAVVRQLESQAS